MRHIIDFDYFGVPILLIYEINKKSGEYFPVVCFNKAAKVILPFEKRSYKALDKLLDSLCERLPSTPGKNLLIIDNQEPTGHLRLTSFAPTLQEFSTP